MLIVPTYSCCSWITLFLGCRSQPCQTFPREAFTKQQGRQLLQFIFSMSILPNLIQVGKKENKTIVCYLNCFWYYLDSPHLELFQCGQRKCHQLTYYPVVSTWTLTPSSCILSRSTHTARDTGFWMEMLAQPDRCCQSSTVWSALLLMNLPRCASRTLLMTLSELCKSLAYQLAEVYTINFILQVKYPKWRRIIYKAQGDFLDVLIICYCCLFFFRF